ncbi:hypothetical protein JOH51_003854 [Rhizobium leguminosarum]|nr:hypothetical protein [Rhizobium leguminosarum]
MRQSGKFIIFDMPAVLRDVRSQNSGKPSAHIDLRYQGLEIYSLANVR